MAHIGQIALLAEKHISPSHPQYQEVLRTLHQFLVIEAVKTKKEENVEEVLAKIHEARKENPTDLEAILKRSFPDFSAHLEQYIFTFFTEYV